MSHSPWRLIWNIFCAFQTSLLMFTGTLRGEGRWERRPAGRQAGGREVTCFAGLILFDWELCCKCVVKSPLSCSKSPKGVPRSKCSKRTSGYAHQLLNMYMRRVCHGGPRRLPHCTHLLTYLHTLVTKWITLELQLRKQETEAEGSLGACPIIA